MALDIGQTEIENDQRQAFLELLQRDLAIGGFENVIALRAQPHPQQFSDRRLVIDDQNLDGGSIHAAVSSSRTSALIAYEPKLQFFALTRFPDANRHSLRLKTRCRRPPAPAGGWRAP